MSMITVPAKGPVDSPFVIVGEAPGSQEIKLRQPFVGPSGMVLNEALAQLTHPEPYVTNVIPHLIGAGKDPAMLSSLVSQHRQRVLDEIHAHPRKIVLALGAAALWALTGDHSYKITQHRGKRFTLAGSEYGMVATTHPAYLLRGKGSFRQFKADVAYAISLASGGLPHEFVPPTWEYLRTIEQVEQFLLKVKQHKGVIAGDIETKGFDHRQSHILMSGFTLDGKHIYIVPGKKREYIAEGQPDMHPYIGWMWDRDFAPEVAYSWHNGKFDVKFFQHQYQQAARVDHDTMLLSYALDETRGIHDLETVASDWLGSPNWKKMLDEHRRQKDSYDVIPEPILAKYMAYDIANTYNLTHTLRPIVARDAKSELLYTKTLIPASAYLAKIETAGMFVDLERVEVNRAAYQIEADKYKHEINTIAIDSGFGPINPNSPVQLSNFFFNTLRLPSKEKGTSEKVLSALPDHPAVIALRKYRKVNKALTTYVTPAIDYLSDDGRVHPSYLLHGTATGRLACRDPNLQNIPREPKLRGQFIPRAGRCFVEVDLNQAELRSLAALSGDAELCRIYTDATSKGLHEEVRADLYGHRAEWSDAQYAKYIAKWYITGDSDKEILDRVLEEQKMRAKNVNFGIVYGITAFGLSEQIEDTPMEAARMLGNWARKFPGAWKFIQLCRNAPIYHKNLVTVFGHKKRFGVVAPENLVAIQNEAANFPHQSTASTITIHGGMLVQDRLKREFDTDIVNTVHDSLLMEMPLDADILREATEYVIKTVEQVPVDWGITRVPFKADAKAGVRWGSMKGLTKFIDEHFPPAS